MNNAVFGGSMEDVRKHGDIKFIETWKRRNYSNLEPNYHSATLFTENILATEMKKTQILMNKPIYLGLWILDLRKTVMHEFCHDDVKPKYGENVKLCYMDTGSFIVHIKTHDIYKVIAENVEKRFETSNYEIDWLLPKDKNK